VGVTGRAHFLLSSTQWAAEKGYTISKNFDRFIARPVATTTGGRRVLPHESNHSPMKNDPIFKIVAAIVVAGVLTALVSPAHSGASTSTAKPAPAHVSGEAQ
jgi:hypothetical protein